MKVDIVKSGKNRYKIISKSSQKHEALEHLAEMLESYNKYADIKIGVYNVTQQPFSLFKNVYSYISKRSERMGKKKWYDFIKGNKQIKAKKNSMDNWKALDPQKESELVLDFLND